MPIEKPIVTEIAKDTFLINEFGLDVMFLLRGEQRALLIDTGSGIFGLKELVEKLRRGLPLTVALTHGHVDHAGGIRQFDEVYVHPADADMASCVTKEERSGYAETIQAMSNGVFAYDARNLPEFGEVPAFRELHENQVFDLGGRRVSVIETPGHTPGSVSFIDDKSRILFSGDACNPNLLLAFPGKSSALHPTGKVSTALRSLRNMEAHAAEFERNYNGHVGYAGWVDCMAQPDSVLPDCIACCEGILNGTIRKTPVPNLLFGKPGEVALYGGIRISYDENCL